MVKSLKSLRNELARQKRIVAEEDEAKKISREIRMLKFQRTRVGKTLKAGARMSDRLATYGDRMLEPPKKKKGVNKNPFGFGFEY